MTWNELIERLEKDYEPGFVGLVKYWYSSFCTLNWLDSEKVSFLDKLSGVAYTLCAVGMIDGENRDDLISSFTK